MLPLDKVRDIISKHNSLEKDLSTGSVDKKKFAEKSKEYSDLSDIINEAKEYLSFDREKIDLEKIINDKKSDEDIKDFANKELLDLIKKNEINEKKIKIYLLPKDEADSKNAIIEIRAGTGGLEASLFASDLFKMYEKVSQKKKWSLDIISISKSEAGGLKEVIATIKGKNIYSSLKYESGVHRVQRVPDTETQGRVHTSAATVAVLPEAEDVELEINTSDIRKDTYRASGAGGQHVNKTESAVRLTHEPTGVVVECQDGRSQHANYDKAMKVLRSKLYELEIKKQNEEIAGQRKSMVGSGDRSDKIRTYNFPQARVTDHRINYTVYNLSEIISGDLFSFTEKLRIAENAEKMKVGSGG